MTHREKLNLLNYVFFNISSAEILIFSLYIGSNWFLDKKLKRLRILSKLRNSECSVIHHVLGLELIVSHNELKVLQNCPKCRTIMAGKARDTEDMLKAGLL